jgi:hypothetical protein
MFNLNNPWQSTSTQSSQAYNIRIELVDEQGNHVDPHHLKEVEYLSRFQNKCVVNKVYHQMIANQQSGIIEVYQDKIVIKES